MRPRASWEDGLAVDRGQMDDTGASTDSHGYAGRICVLRPDCVGTEAVAPVHATILLSLFPFSVFGRSVDVIITSNRMDYGHKRADAALGGKCEITSQLMAIDRRCVCVCVCG